MMKLNFRNGILSNKYKEEIVNNLNLKLIKLSIRIQEHNLSIVISNQVSSAHASEDE